MKLSRLSILALAVFLGFFLGMLIVSLCLVRVSPNGPFNTYSQTLFSLFSYIPVSAWVALFSLEALLLLVYSGYPRGLSPKVASFIVFALFLLVFAFIYGLPHIIETNPRFVDSWIHGKTAEAIVENGYLQPSQFNYQTYPSSFIFLSSLSIITGADITLWLRVLPFIFTLLFFSFFTLFVRELFGDLRLAVISGFIFGASAYNLTFHFSPENFGWLLLLLFFAVLAKGIRENGSSGFSSRRFFIVFALLAVTIATAHFVSLFMISVISLVLLIMGNWIWKTRLGVLVPIVLLLVTFSTWSIFFSISNITILFDGLRNAISKILLNPMSSIAARPFQTYTPPDVANLLLFRRVLYVAIPFTAFFGAFFLRKQNKKMFVFLVGFLVASLLPIPLTFFGTLPLERTIRLAFIPLSIFSAYLVVTRKKLGVLVLAFLLLSVPLNFASLYWNEIGTSVAFDWEVSAAKFAASSFQGVILGEFKETGILDFFGNFSQTFNDYHLIGTEPPDVFNLNFIESHGVGLVYITQMTVLNESQTSNGSDTIFMPNSTFFDRAYSNGYSYFLFRPTNNH